MYIDVDRRIRASKRVGKHRVVNKVEERDGGQFEGETKDFLGNTQDTPSLEEAQVMGRGRRGIARTSKDNSSQPGAATMDHC